MHLAAVKARDVDALVKSATFAALPPFVPLSPHSSCLRDTLINNRSACMSNTKEDTIRENSA